MNKKGLWFIAFSSVFLGIGFLNNVNLELPVRDTTVIVELKDLYGESKEARKEVRSLFYQELNSKVTTNYSVDFTLDELANYIILKVNSNDIYYIQNLETVEFASKERYYQPAEVTTSSVESDPNAGSFNPDLAAGPDKNYSRIEMNVKEENTKDGEGTLIAVLDNSFQLDHEALVDLSDDQVKYTKAEMKAMVTGNSLNAKGDFDKQLYCNNKVPFYYDYANSDNDVLNTKENHGIHVSSIAAANGPYKGIAPNAQLALMKVFPDNGSGASDGTVLRALNDCAKIGVDVVNMSLGSSLWDEPGDRAAEDGKDETTYSSAFRAFQKLSERGVQFAVSAGNEGRGNYLKDNDQTKNYGLYPNLPTDQAELGILGSYANSSYATIVASSRLQADTSLKDATAYRQKVSGFSSDGVTWDLRLNPDIITPGESIWGATYYPAGSTTKYVYMDGTSMAAPNYAGVVANVLSNGDFTTDEERQEYQLTLERRIQSTATPLTQEVGGVVTGFYSPRKQGAGLPNVAHAIDTGIYLEGVRNKAKIELQNNDDVKVGRLNFDVKTINESTESEEYTATLYVQAPALSSDKSYATLFDQKLEEHTKDVTILPGENSINFDYTISENSKEILKEFDQGTYLEGYVIFTPKDSSNKITLSIPFLGYYGDYAKATPVEPFEFEQKDNKLYGSDLLNDAYYTFKSRPNADFTSMIVTSERAFTTSDIQKFASGESNPVAAGGTKAIYDETSDSITVGLKGLSSNLLIQQYVYRSVTANTVKLIKQSNNQTVYSTKMSNYSDNGKYNMTTGRLLKSIFASPGTESEASKAYTTIALRGNTGNLLYAEGLYTLEFTYDTTYGSTVVKTYTLNIIDGEASAPKVVDRNLSGETNARVLRIDLEDNVIRAVANYEEVTIKSDSNGKFINLNISDYTSRKKILLELENSVGLKTTQLFNTKDIEDGYAVEHNGLVLGYNVVFKVTKGTVDETSNTFTNRYQTVINDARGNETDISTAGGYKVLLFLPFNATDVVVSATEKVNGVDTAVVTELNGTTLSYVTQSGDVSITFNFNGKEEPDNPDVPDEPETPEEPTTPSNENTAAIVGGVVGGVVGVSLIALGVLIYVKKRKGTLK